MRKECNKAKIELNKIKAGAKSLGHIPEYVSGGGFSDGIVCSCGWKSRQYWDLIEAASDEWIKHAKEVIKAGQIRLNL